MFSCTWFLLAKPKRSTTSRPIPHTLNTSLSGFYIAHHPWLLNPLTSQKYYKIGCSERLDQRLLHSSFTTCFTDAWGYVAVLRVPTFKQALLIEYCVLRLLEPHRVPGRELIHGIDDSIILQAALRVAQEFDVQHVLQQAPVIFETQSQSAKKTKEITTTNKHQSLALLEIPKLKRMFEKSSLRDFDVFATEGKKSEAAVVGVGEEEDGLCNSEDIVLDMSYFSKTATTGGVGIESSVSLDPSATFTPLTLRDYQVDASRAVVEDLARHQRCILQMACRCGKTPVAFDVITNYAKRDSNIFMMYLVPGLALLRQTALKLVGYGFDPRGIMLVGSEKLTVPVLFQGKEQHVLTMSTDLDTIAKFLDRSTDDGQTPFPCVVLSTYQSSPLLVPHLSKFKLAIFDECHRVCGKLNASTFNTILHAKVHEDSVQQHRLFMTATPAYDTPISMHQKELFGGIAYRYHLRSGINAGYVNNFAVRIVVGTPKDSMASQILSAMETVDKMLVFCRTISECEELARETQELLQKNSKEIIIQVLIAHSRMAPGAPSVALQQFRTPGRMIMFNVRLFQEGVEVPTLNAVFFACPKFSPRDIVQSICRPLNRVDGKPPSMVFIPVTHDTDSDPTSPVNMKNYSTLVPFSEALLSEDPALFEYLIDPKNFDYNIGVIGTSKVRKVISETLQDVVLPSIRRAMRFTVLGRDRFSRVENLPWPRAFAELQRIVATCHRYPKTTDAWVIGDGRVAFYNFYSYCRVGYRQYLERNPSCPLEPHQIRDLESLPHWNTYGLNGPYHWEESMVY
eukprot:PhF_6_TR43101/c0_g1_i5/m.65848